jgi:glycosyltransferase involved in cell wall biosynthesis
MAHLLLRTRALGVVVPVHNEEELLGEALHSLADAFAELRDVSIATHVVLVFDSCRDASASVARRWHESLSRRSPLVVSAITCEANSVGVARKLGCAVILEHWNMIDPSMMWIATTDADSRVPRAWLRAQVGYHELGVDLWAGRVAVSDDEPRRREWLSRWQRQYDAELHPVHGASLGFNAEKYLVAGGFAPIQTGEDRALVRSLVDSGARAFYDSTLPVVTSPRRTARAPHGFAEALHDFDADFDAIAD